MHPGRTAWIYLEDEVVGFVGQVHPTTAKAYDIPETYVAELNLQQLVATEAGGLLMKQFLNSQQFLEILLY